jgi:membrane protein
MAAALLFFAVPNCQVTLRYAIYGGLVTTLLFEVMKSFFAALVANSSYYIIYGAFAALPLFLLWIYLGWTLVLAGAEFVRSLETFETTMRGYKFPNMTAVLIILWEAQRLQERGEAISDRAILKVGIENQHWQYLRDLLLSKHVLTSTDNKQFVVTRDLYHMQLRELSEMLGGGYKSAPSQKAKETLEHYHWFHGLTDILTEINKTSDRLLSKTIGELFDEHA